MICIEKIFISVVVITSCIGPYPIAKAVENYAEASESATERQSLGHRIKPEDCTLMPQGLRKLGVACGPGDLVLSLNDSAGREDSDQDLSESSPEVKFEQNTISVVSSSHSGAGLLPKIDVGSRSSGGLTENLNSESDKVTDNTISGSLLASILALIAIVAVARRNV